jgi:hypothetical protein
VGPFYTWNQCLFKMFFYCSQKGDHSKDHLYKKWQSSIGRIIQIWLLYMVQRLVRKT